MKKLAVLFTIAFILGSCANSTNSTNSTQTLVSAQEFETAINSADNPVILDVRTPGEYEGGHIANAMNVDWNGSDFDSQIASIDKDAPVYVYCLSGGRSGKAVSHLKDKGYTNVVELDGGMMAWRSASLPETTDVEKVDTELTSKDYAKLISSENYVLVDFNAVWCAPCVKLKPILDEIGKEYADKVTIVGIDVDKNPTIASQLNINGIPDMKLYKGGKLVWETRGLVAKSVIVEQLK